MPNACATPIGDVAAYRFAANQRRSYERMAGRPRALVPIGDALCAFNPIYGQGMTAAAREAVALRDALGAGPDGLERRYLRAAATIVDDAWRLAAGADLDGGAGRDTLLGGDDDGEDELDGGEGPDVLDGQAGRDVATYALGSPRIAGVQVALDELANDGGPRTRDGTAGATSCSPRRSSDRR